MKSCSILCGLSAVILLFSCAKSEQPESPFEIPVDKYGNTIPDFSRVGYKWGDEAIPNVSGPVTKVAAPTGKDDTKLIQDAIDKATAPGVVLLPKGTYKASGIIFLDRDGLVLRGESDTESIIVATGTGKRPLIVVGKTNNRTTSTSVDEEKIETTSPVSLERVYGASSDVVEDYVPVGRMYLRVSNPSLFSTGDRVCIYRPGTKDWIGDIKMNAIGSRTDGGSTYQWKASEYNLYWERTVTKVAGDSVYFDNPVVMALDSDYGGGKLFKSSLDRSRENGIENLTLDSEYDATVFSMSHSPNNKRYEADENHAWSAVEVHSTEHSWIRNIHSKHFGFACVSMKFGSKNVTVSDCSSESPISVIDGSRRYAFNCSAGECILFTNCTTSYDRHQFVTGARVCGPIVFHRCTSKRAQAVAGPHHRWATGLLYDNIETNDGLSVVDAAYLGTGHGWTGANVVFWNCTAKVIACQSPWVGEGKRPSGINYCIGCNGVHDLSPVEYRDGLTRNEGEWLHRNEFVAPQSLYESQLKARAGVKAAPASEY